MIEISGEDALRFLQNLTTNDVKQDYCYGYMLTNRGQYLFDFFIYRISGNKFILDMEYSQKAALLSRLLTYKLRAGIEINDIGNEYEVLYRREFEAISNLVVGKDPRYKGLGYRYVVKKRARLNNQICEYLEDKYNLAIPDGFTDLIYEKSIPLEFGAKELNAVSYGKGCYIGQEVMSRVNYQGVVRKKIFKVTANVQLAAVGKNDIIKAGDQDIGIICSVYKNQAIALLNEEKYLKSQNQKISLNDYNIEISVPFWRSNY